MQEKVQMRITTNTVFNGDVPPSAVTSVNNKTGDVVIDKADLGLDKTLAMDVTFEDGSTASYNIVISE